MLTKAILIATIAHQGQQDKSGKPYIFHPLRVMLSLCTEEEQICGVLHDVLEDTFITRSYLQQQGFPSSILDTLDCLTRTKRQEYSAYIDQILENPLACRVKLMDLKDNMDLSRLPQITEKDELRHEKYIQAKKRIEKKLTHLSSL